MMYIVQVKDLDGSVTYYCAKNLTEARLYQNSTLKFVNVFSAHDFLSKLPKLPIKNNKSKKLDDYML